MSTKKNGMSLRNAYLVGFLLSLLLTLCSYSLVTRHTFNNATTMALIASLAVIQLAVQLIFFLHLDREKRPHWNLLTFLLTVGVLIILVFGSLWIMSNLDYNMHPRSDTEEYIIKDEGFHKN